MTPASATSAAASDSRMGILMMLLGMSLFSINDALGKWLVSEYPVAMLLAIRSLFGAVLLAPMIWREGVRAVFAVDRLPFHLLRVGCVTGEVACFYWAVRDLPLANVMTIYMAAPLIVTALSVPLLGEKVGWKRGSAVVIGLIGVLIIINPVDVHFDASLLLPLTAALMFALYSIATRAVSHKDSAVTSVFYAGVVGALAISLIGPFYWTEVSSSDWIVLGALCVCGALSHYCLIQAYSILPASEVQPVTYLQLVMIVFIAVIFFEEQVTANMVVGAVIVIGAGLFTVWRENRLAKSRKA